MIKSGQIEELSKGRFHYITAITKPQIETLLAGGCCRWRLFDDSLAEVEQEGLRYVLRPQPGASPRKSPPRESANKPAVELLIQQRISIWLSMPRPK